MVQSLALMPPSTRTTAVSPWPVGTKIGPHRLQKVAGLVGDAFQDGSRELPARRAQRYTGQQRPRLTVPVRSAEAHEGGDHIDPLRWVRFSRKRTGLSGRSDQAETITQPLNRRAGYKNRPLQCIGAHAVELVRNGGHQTMRTDDCRPSGVEQGEAAGAVGGFHHAGLEAGLPISAAC